MRPLKFSPVVIFLCLLLPAIPALAAVISNGGTVLNLYGTSGSDTITNTGTVTYAIYGNSEGGSDGGFNNIINMDTGMVGAIYGSWNEVDGSRAGSNRITNSGWGSELIGSANIGAGSSGGSNSIMNMDAGMVGYIIGSVNLGAGSSGGSNSITNLGVADIGIEGSSNLGDNSSGGSNIIINSGSVSEIIGSGNWGAGSSGGFNNISNTSSGTARAIYGSVNLGDNSSGGSNSITNAGIWGTGIFDVENASDASAEERILFRVLEIVGSSNIGVESSGGSNNITNTVTGMAGTIVGSSNEGTGSSGGSNSINNAGTVVSGMLFEAIGNIGLVSDVSDSKPARVYPASGIVGSSNMGVGSNGGSNSIVNAGSVSGGISPFERIEGDFAAIPLVMVSGIVGSANMGEGSSGGFNSITNSGTVSGTLIYTPLTRPDYSSESAISLTTVNGIVGSFNMGAGSSGGGNSIDNSGIVEGDIYGSYNLGDGSSSTGNTIVNSGTVVGSVYGSYNYGLDASGGDDSIINSGGVTGSIYGEDGNDIIIVAGGSVLGGVADGGSEIDTLGFNNMGTMDGSLLGTTYLNFENLGIYGGTTTLTGAWNFSGGSTTVYAGNLFVEGSLSTGSFSVEQNGFADITGSVSSDTTMVYGSMNVDGILSTGSFTVGQNGFADITGSVNSDATMVYGSMDVDGILSTGSFTVGQNGFVNIAGSVNSIATMVNGHMNVNGSLFTDDLTVASSGFLNGSGHIYGDVVNYGTISPGNSIGTLTVDGTLSFMPGSVYVVELTASGTSDLINVNGSVQLHGGTVWTALPRSLYTNGQNWTIISATGGVSGTFASLADNLNSQTLDLSLRYGGNQVLLEIERTPFASFGTTPNENGVGSGLDGLVSLADGGMEALITAMDFDMNQSQIQNVLHALSPEMYTAFSTAGMKSMSVVGQTTALHQADQRQRRELGLSSTTDSTVAGVERNWDLWMQGLGNWSEQDAEDNYLGHSQDMAGIVTGVDGIFSDWLRAGLFVGYSDSNLEWDGTVHSGDMQGVHIGACAGADLDGFFLDALSGYANFDNSATRDIRFDGFSARAGNDFDSSAWQGRLEGGYDFKMNNWLLSPLVSMEYTRLEQDEFSETGADFLNLHMGESTSDSTAGTLGVRFSGVVKSEHWQFLPGAELRWLHQLQDEGTSIIVNFVDYGTSPFMVTGIAPVDNQGLVSLGLTAQYGQNISLFFNCALALADGYSSNQLSGGLSWKF